MAYPLFLTVRKAPAPEDVPTLREFLEQSFSHKDNIPYLDGLCGSSLPRVTAERLGALSLLPSLLAAAEIDSAPLILRRDEHGRPYCESAHGSVDFDFNLSHSAGHIAAALLVGGGRVGVDIEEFIPPGRALPLIRRYCTEGELALFTGIEDTEDSAATLFTGLWTGREALAKQNGRGMPLRFDCTRIPSELWLWRGRVPESRTELALCAPTMDHPCHPCILLDSLPVVCM